MRPRASYALGALSGALLLGVAVLLLTALGVLGGSRGPALPPSAIELSHGIPVGVQDTAAGALAAADNYLALASQSIEQDPAQFAELVANVYEPGVRARTLSEAQELRARDSQNMANYAQGGRGIAVIAARRLDSYTSTQAVITTWLGGFVWGPRLTPRQSWNLVDTTLRWRAGRWLVLACNTDPIAAPVPSIAYVNGPNDRSPAFRRLAGMTAPFYGTGG